MRGHLSSSFHEENGHTPQPPHENELCEFTPEVKISVETFGIVSSLLSRTRLEDALSISSESSTKIKSLPLQYGRVCVRPFHPIMQVETAADKESRKASYTFDLLSHLGKRSRRCNNTQDPLFSLSSIDGEENGLMIVVYRGEDHVAKPKSRRHSRIVVPSNLSYRDNSSLKSKLSKAGSKKGPKKEVRFKMDFEDPNGGESSERVHAVIRIKFQDSYSLARFVFTLVSLQVESCFSSTCFLINCCRLGGKKGASSTFDFGDNYVFFRRHGELVKHYFPRALIPEVGTETKKTRSSQRCEMDSTNCCSLKQRNNNPVLDAAEPLQNKIDDTKINSLVSNKNRSQTLLTADDFVKALKMVKNVNINNGTYRERQAHRRLVDFNEYIVGKKEVKNRKDEIPLYGEFSRPRAEISSPI
mmetsp:Transcript_1745/g.1992  ORF Transcript_1745/g.1992 Transcript_1745/m.1992 type:complete len:415 (+) Transcript_1745:149-1393(+)